jgi:DUF4097 and DUF4098 domain-containing protein YvlB
MRANVLALAAFAVVPLQIGCDLESFAEGNDRFREDFQYSYNLPSGGRISVDTFNGSVEVLSWEKEAVQITGTKYASREADLAGLKIDVKADDSSVQVRAIRPELRRGNMGAKFFIRVPRRVQLDVIRSSNGQIRVEDVEGDSRLETSNGSIRLRKVAGRLDARTSNGAIEGGDVEGSAVLRTSNGAIRLDHIRGGVQATTSNGTIQIAMMRPAAGERLGFESSNGSLDLGFEELSNNEIHAATSNSSITLRVPTTLKAQLRASTSNSSITSDLEVATHGALVKNRLEGEINGGGPLIHLTTSNGSIKLLRQ